MSTEPDKEEHEVNLVVPLGYREEARLDVFLTRNLLNVTRSKVQKGIKEGRVHVNGRLVTRPSHPVHAGDRIKCKVLRSPPIQAVPEEIPLDIVFEDEWLLVVNKPAGMVVHPAYGNRTGTLVNALLHYVGAGTVTIDSLEDDDGDSGLSTGHARPASDQDPAIRPGIVHRLDKDTSGLLVVAKNDFVHAGLAKQFADRTITRDYLALVLGVPEESGTIQGDIGRSKRDRKKMAVRPAGGGKAAVTHFERIETYADSALVRFRLETGRTHQIRVHAASVGHPVLGDETYGGSELKRAIRSRNRRAFYKNLLKGLGRQALHARTLGFVHPVTGEAVQFECDPPAEMAGAIARLRENAEVPDGA
ncbi:MAG: RluA family pseudouridine synthase [Rhodothermia bacterium]|nr:RluA family pseudouridine synthase [Rhodothermia bacterium]